MSEAKFSSSRALGKKLSPAEVKETLRVFLNKSF